MNNGNFDTAYNTGQDIPYILSKIFEFLIEEGSEDFWKAIYYKDYDCLDQPNLTMSEKRKLIYTNGKNLNDYNIYLNAPLISPEEDNAKTILKAYILRVKPITQMDFVVSFNFDIITHTTLSNIEKDTDMVSRIDFIESELIRMLNQRDFFFGRVKFDHRTSTDSHSMLAYNNSNNFFGRCLTMAVLNTRHDENIECEEVW